MTYDFNTLVDRTDTGSVKWETMREIKPNVSEGVVPFSVADMEFKTPTEIIEGLKDYMDEGTLGYTLPTESYYESVVVWMRSRHGFTPDKEWFVLFPGVVPALQDMIGAFTKPDESVLIMTPVYYPFRLVVQHHNRTLVESELMPKGDTYEIDFADFESKCRREDVTLFILCSPHNPIGRVFTKEELEKIAAICLENNVFILSDEIHFDLIMPEYEHVSMATLEDTFLNNCAVCTAPSKTFNIAGLQVSNIFIKNGAKRAKLQEYQGMVLLNAFAYKACEIAYTKCESWLDALLEQIDENRKLVERFFEKNIPSAKVYTLQGSYLMWIDFRYLGLSPEALEQFMINQAELFLDEGYIFGQGGQGFERINIACPGWVLENALIRLHKALSEGFKGRDA